MSITKTHEVFSQPNVHYALFRLYGIAWKIWWRWVGAVPMCPPVSPRRDASIVSLPTHNACVFGMETPLRGRSGGHTGAAPTHFA